ncbi:MAG TPA: type II CAAX endopeptidase family protein [Candidatus Saccharimonadales bacterium]|nr:type II CAAX endopeptidase family protein [Candidatus Saccharimonadales bacterium]
MSDTSSNHPQYPSAEPPAKKQLWGPWTALWIGFLIFVVPMFVIAEIAYLTHWNMPNQDLQQFYMYAGSIAITLILLRMVLQKRYNIGFKQLGLNHFYFRYIGYALLTLPIYFICSAALTEIVSSLYHGFNIAQQQNTGFTGSAHSSVLELTAVFVSLVIIPPLVEETLFRGFLLQGMRKRFPAVIAVILVSLIFGAAHGQLNVGIDTFTLSCFLCFLRIKTESLWPGILLHATKNFIAFIALYHLFQSFF